MFSSYSNTPKALTPKSGRVFGRGAATGATMGATPASSSSRHSPSPLFDEGDDEAPATSIRADTPPRFAERESFPRSAPFVEDTHDVVPPAAKGLPSAMNTLHSLPGSGSLLQSAPSQQPQPQIATVPIAAAPMSPMSMTRQLLSERGYSSETSRRVSSTPTVATGSAGGSRANVAEVLELLSRTAKAQREAKQLEPVTTEAPPPVPMQERQPNLVDATNEQRSADAQIRLQKYRNRTNSTTAQQAPMAPSSLGASEASPLPTANVTGDVASGQYSDIRTANAEIVRLRNELKLRDEEVLSLKRENNDIVAQLADKCTELDLLNVKRSTELHTHEAVALRSVELERQLNQLQAQLGVQPDVMPQQQQQQQQYRVSPQQPLVDANVAGRTPDGHPLKDQFRVLLQTAKHDLAEVQSEAHRVEQVRHGGYSHHHIDPVQYRDTLASGRSRSPPARPPQLPAHLHQRSVPFLEPPVVSSQASTGVRPRAGHW